MSACGSGSDGSPPQEPAKTQEEIFLTINEAEEKYGSLNHIVDIPSKPNRGDDTATILGIDANSNGVRDIHERIIYKSLTLIDSSDASSYNSVLNIIKMIQPKDPAEENSIDEHEIYCTYEALSDDIKNEFSLDFLTEMVIDTEMRRNAFYQSIKPSSVSLGEEICD
jgi:hypothetical protein